MPHESAFRPPQFLILPHESAKFLRRLRRQNQNFRTAYTLYTYSGGEVRTYLCNSAITADREWGDTRRGGRQILRICVAMGLSQ